jgi:hypothetical protein
LVVTLVDDELAGVRLVRTGRVCFDLFRRLQQVG